MSVMTPPQSDATQADSETIAETAERAVARITEAKADIGRIIFGQQAVVEQTLVTILAGGHGLLVGVPGLAKTKLVETLGYGARASTPGASSSHRT
jgi:MoxR-like ATPase